MWLKTLSASILLSAITSTAFSQQLQVPEKWGVEKIILPPEFAPSLPLKGTEDLRFSPQWDKKNTPGYWTYCFLWTLLGNTAFTAEQLEGYFREYYTGLIKSQYTKAHTDTASIHPVIVSLHPKAHKNKTERQAFEGTIAMTDYMTGQPLVLNFRIHVMRQQDEAITVVYVEASPQPYDNDAWNIPDELDKTIKW